MLLFLFLSFLQFCSSQVVNGGWGEWSSVWSGCSVTCGDGTRSRTRACNNPEPANGGASCVGSSVETEACNAGTQCAVNGGFGAWGSWSACSTTCDQGTRSRTRSCNNPVPAAGGLDCVGETIQFENCNNAACAVDGGWSAWSAFSVCSATCGGGSQTQTRVCNNPPPTNGGAACIGSSSFTQDCNTQSCAVNGGWSAWSAFSSCSVTCGTGTQTQTRSCTNPIPSGGGLSCVGLSIQSQTCNTQACAVNGGWSAWSAFSACSATCGTGTQTQTRSCTNPPPSAGGNSCSGLSIQSQTCNVQSCAVNGGWSAWSAFSTCSVTCGSGTQTQTRSCTNPVPSGGGSSCVGLSLQSQSCNVAACPTAAGWSSWGAFGACRDDCTQAQTRTCVNPALGCAGPSTNIAACSNTTCRVGGWSCWSSWSGCGGNQQVQVRTCTDPAPLGAGSVCTGSSMNARNCSSTCGNTACEDFPCGQNAICSPASGNQTGAAGRVCACAAGYRNFVQGLGCSRIQVSSSDDDSNDALWALFVLLLIPCLILSCLGALLMLKKKKAAKARKQKRSYSSDGYIPPFVQPPPPMMPMSMPPPPSYPAPAPVYSGYDLPAPTAVFDPPYFSPTNFNPQPFSPL
eukprot:NODE_620_length_2008_cov_220.447103_g576_i0.p1 GENE.NODE_620_length_2008_cov_220.447103_g576_i0~~NODE_620_length_2008_cov_220.447103_g576_i0.p1  ORF type:complete len:643 (-),score=45.94 NODE_620_length_2008_cov_220.447103_g576_i0:79-1953(-)